MSSNDQATMAEFAQNLWNNYIKQKTEEANSSVVSYYRAVVTTANDGSNILKVKQPFETTSRTVSCTDELADVAVGTNVVIMRMGNGNAAVNNLAFLALDDMSMIKTPIPISKGGTGQTTASAALLALGGLPVLTTYPEDLDDVTTTCITNYPGTAGNTPNSAGGSLLTKRFSSTYIHQMAMPNSATGAVTVYVRMHYSEGWTPWTNIA